MANAKQAGSNLLNAEYTWGRCATQCEQCFVNWGQNGQATCKALVNPGSEEQLAWSEREGKATGYVPPPALPKGSTCGPDEELLLRKVTHTGKGFWNIPSKTAYEPKVVSAKSAAKAQTGYVKDSNGKDLTHLGEFKFFLRVASMSDAAWASPEWLRLVRSVWGDACFFNSAIRSLKAVQRHGRDAVVAELHKLVVTLNPGHQKLMPMREQICRYKDPVARDRQMKKFYREEVMKFSAFGTMTEVAEDFLHPTTVTDIGMSELERRIKFYRLRALPTIMGRVETDRPVVITQMRFKGPDHVAEFARRYGLECEYRLPSGKKLSAMQAARLKPFLDRGLIKVVNDSKVTSKTMMLRTSKSDKRNASPNRGAWTRLIHRSSFWRVDSSAGFDSQPYVCDRLFGGCALCGLCATLDGTGRTIDGVRFTNPLNVAPWGDVILPLPYRDGAGYVGAADPVAGGHGDHFAAKLRDIGVQIEFPELQGLVGSEWRLNPEGPAHPDDAASVLHDVGKYLLQGESGREFVQDDWNTHENAAAATAFAVWSLMCVMKRAGKTFADAWAEIVRLVDEEVGVDVLGGVDDLEGMWNGDSDWNDQFGPVR